MSNPTIINTGANWKNVNNWHWIEKDCTAWAHDRIKSLLSSVSIPSFSITKVNGIEGEVSVNQRKGKVKQLFDLEIKFEYSLLAGDETKTTGTGFISDFTADYDCIDDLNLKLTPRLDAKIQEQVLQAVGAIAEAFKAELFEVHGRPLLLESAGTSASEMGTCVMGTGTIGSNVDNASGTSTPSASATTTSTCTTTSTPTQSTSTPTPSTNTLTQTITDEVEFPCPCDQIYLMLTDPVRIRSWSHSPASIPQILIPQASFTLFDGNILCKLLALQPHRLIEMEWKLKGWSEWSRVTITIEPADNGKSLLKMMQTGVPGGEAQTVQANWHNYYWNPIKRAFGILH